MKFRMLSLLSIILVLTVKSMEISAKDYYELRVAVNAIPPDPYAPHLFPYPLENKLDSIVFRIAQSSFVIDPFATNIESDSENIAFFNDLSSTASEQELNALMMHTSPAVKIYAYRSLLMNNMNMNCDFELALLQDTTCVSLKTNDELIPSTVKELVQNDFNVFK